MSKKNMTIDELAEKIDRFTETVDKRFDSVDKRFDSVDKKIEDEVGNLANMTQQEFLAIHQRMDNSEKKFEKKFDDLHKEQLSHDFKMTEMVHKADYFKLEERINKIEFKLGLKR